MPENKSLLAGMSKQVLTESFVLENKHNSLCLPDWDTMGPRHPLETAWDLSLVLAICATNVFLIVIFSTSHCLWRPRHLLMMALCVGNLLLGMDQLYGLGLDLWPQQKLCVIHRMTIGIPVHVNSLLSALISIDRFIAVQFPFFYQSSVSNFHVIPMSSSLFFKV